MSTNFTYWHKWSDRNTIEELHFPGVYAIAVTEEYLSNKPFSLLPELKYFGMTNSKGGLKARLKQFDNTIKGKSGHGGADRFRHKYPDYAALVNKLYVAVAPFTCDVNSNLPEDLEIMGDVSKFEFICFANYVRKFERLPEFNDKANAPKYSLTVGRK